MKTVGSVFDGTTRTGVGCMLLASIGALLFGIDNGWWSTLLGAETFLRDYGSCAVVDGTETCNLSTGQRSAGSAVQSAGVMVACLFAVYLNDYLGRRMAMVVTGIISLIGVVIEMTSSIGAKPRFSQFVVGKTIAAISMGLCANIVPICLSETSTARARGAAVGLYQNVLMVGVIIASGTVYATSGRKDPSSYLIPIGLQLFPPVVMVLASPFLPESPRWLVWKGRLDDAQAASQRLFGSPTSNFNAAEYVSSIELAIEEDRNNSAQFHGWTDLLRGPDLRRVLIAIGVQFSFLEAAGVKDVFPVIMGVNVIYWASILTGHYLPDKFGRRPMMMVTTTFCGATLLAIAIMVTAVEPATDAVSKAAIALVFIWNIGFGIESPLVWIITAESSPTCNRERVLAVAVFIGFGVSLMITSVAPYIQDEGYGNIGGKIGFIWASFSFVTAVWVFFFLPEMKGFSLEQLDYLFANGTATRKFSKIEFADDILADEQREVKDALGEKEKDIEHGHAEIESRV